MPNNILLFSAEQISFMSFYYVQDVYQRNHLRARLDQRPDIINGKASVASVKGAGGSGEKRGTLSHSAGDLGTLRKFSGSNKHLDWLKIDLNVAEIICRVKVKSQAGNIRVKDIITQKGQSQKKIS